MSQAGRTRYFSRNATRPRSARRGEEKNKALWGSAHARAGGAPLLPLLIMRQIPLKSKWRKSTDSNITLTLPTLPHSLGLGTFALNSQNYNPHFEKILDPPLLTLNLTLNKMKYAMKSLLIKKETEWIECVCCSHLIGISWSSLWLITWSTFSKHENSSFLKKFVSNLLVFSHISQNIAIATATEN